MRYWVMRKYYEEGEVYDNLNRLFDNLETLCEQLLVFPKQEGPVFNIEHFIQCYARKDIK